MKRLAKKSMLIATAIMAIAPAMAQKVVFSLQGTADATLNGSTVYLQDEDKRDTIATATIADGQFCIKATLPSPAIATVGTSRSNSIELVLETGTIEANLTAGTVRGTRQNFALNEYTQREKILSDSFKRQYRRIMADSTKTQEQRREELQKTQEIYIQQFREELMSLYGENPDRVLGMYAVLNVEPYIEVPKDYYELLKKIRPPYSGYRRMQARLTDMVNLMKTQPGEKFIDFSCTDGSGKTYRLSDYVGRGKYVLADFWASWCGPCRAEMPFIRQIYQKYAAKGKMTVLGIAVWDKEEATRKAMKELSIDWPVIINAQKTPTDIYGIRGIPELIVFAPDGTIKSRGLRGEKLVAEIDKLMSSKQ